MQFEKPGISYIFCDIHPEMSAVIIALPTPYYGISDQQGQVVMPNVPAGKYALHIWYESALPEQLNAMTREIEVSEQQFNPRGDPPRRSQPASRPQELYGQDYRSAGNRLTALLTIRTKRSGALLRIREGAPSD